MKSYIEIPLPFCLPIKEGVKAVSGYENKYFQMEFEPYVIYVSEDKKEFTELNQTQLNITYIYDGEEVLDNLEDRLRGVLYNCLGYINDYLSALRFTQELNYIKPISVYDLPEHITIEIDNELYLYITSPLKLIEEKEILSSESMAKTQSMIATWDKYPEIGLVDRFYSSAKHSISAENFISAIIDLQTSFEIFIQNTMRLIIIQDGKRLKKPKKEIDKEIQNTKKLPFRNLIEQHLSKKLKIKLHFQNHATMNNWYEKLYKLRNDIVHSGKFNVNGNEAKDAYDSYVEIRNYISDKLVEKKYLTREGNIELKYFQDIYSNPTKQHEIQDKLRRYGLLPDGLEFLPKK